MIIPTVSVVMNIRNGYEFLREALDSVLAQTFTNWELIVWDDCSTDDSPALVAEYTDPRIRYLLSPEDTPLGAARRNAIRHASGEWVAFLDQDDIWLPTKLQKQLELANDPSVGLIYGRTVSFFPDGAQRDYDHRHEFCPLPEGSVFLDLFRDSCFIAVSSAMFRRSVLNEIGPIPDSIHVSPDYYLYLKVARHHNVRAVQDVVCRYRRHDDNMTLRVSARMHNECLWIIDQWQSDLNPALAAQRRFVHQTLVAVHEIQRGESRWKGLVRLFTRGSVLYLLSRPFAKTFRMLRRKSGAPLWTRSDYARSLAPAVRQTGVAQNG